MDRDPAGQDAFLREACAGDEGLRREVESLLGYEGGADALLERPAAAVAAPMLNTSVPSAVLTGRQIGPYQIGALLGAGGMGEVYRARDTQLNREVALKVLPESFATDSERLARFQREAEVLAALNHPNIAAIYGLQEADGLKALVMELVEGEDLAGRIGRGSVPIDEALPIARQIADALEAAHEQGVVHRDLKPANIKVRPDGTLKVLDFGLAKAMESTAVPAANAANSPTVAATQVGTIIGTAAYMAPEQARGKAVDKRADIWAFGVVLYEMLTGRRAFDGDGISDVLAAVLRQDIDWTALPADTPESIRRLLRRCLVKDTRPRLADMSAVRVEIDDALAGTPSAVAQDSARVRRRRVDPSLVVVALMLAALTGAATWWLKPDAAAPRRVVRSSVPVSASAASTWARTRHVIAVSPDGTRIAYLANSKLFVRELDQFEAKEIPRVTDPREVFFSSDSAWVGFFAAGQLQKVALAGGVPIPICPIEAPLGATWAGDIIVFGQTKGLFRVPATGGTPEPLVAARGDERLGNPHLLPGGTKILFSRWAATSSQDDAETVIEDLSTHVRTVIVRGGSDARYLAAGYVVYSRANEILGVRFDISTLRAGNPVTLIEDEVLGAVQFGISADGTLAYATRIPSTTRLVWIEPGGVEVPITQQKGHYSDPRVSPDGSRIAFSNSVEGNRDVFVLDWARNLTTALTTDPGVDVLPAWTPSGDRIVFGSNRDGTVYNLYWRAADGSGPEERLTNSPNMQVPVSWSKDGKTLFYSEVDPKNLGDIYALPFGEPGANRKPLPLVTTAGSDGAPRLSPDERWLAYHSTERGTSEIMVRPYPNVNSAIHHVAIGAMPRWAPDGSALYYWRDSRIFRVPVTTSQDFKFGNSEEIITDVLPISRGHLYDIEPKGKRFVVAKADEEPSVDEYRLVVNWIEEVKARMKQRR